LSAIEFLAAGVPMICARVGGVPEIVRDKVNGLLYPLGDVDRLASAIAALAEPNYRASLAARAKTSVVSFSAELMVDRYVEEFEALVSS
jgi:glycosyltransferase involved in cell wall biosynthesis